MGAPIENPGRPPRRRLPLVALVAVAVPRRQRLQRHARYDHNLPRRLAGLRARLLQNQAGPVHPALRLHSLLKLQQPVDILHRVDRGLAPAHRPEEGQAAVGGRPPHHGRIAHRLLPGDAGLGEGEVHRLHRVDDRNPGCPAYPRPDAAQEAPGPQVVPEGAARRAGELL